MQANEALKKLMELTGMTAAQLSRATNLDESVVSRTLHGKTIPRFDTIEEAARALGYEVTLTPLEQVTMRLTGAPSMQELVESIHTYAGDADQWSRISASMRNLFEFPDEQPVRFTSVAKDMDRNWSAFMAGLYDHQQWAIDHDTTSLRLDEPWTPLRKIYRSATQPDPDFARYNVILPRGELQWK
ncbi:hypothetical protein BLEM_2104 [Bifidobacterium lemurum]|uniref:HTH cro/C1-type domain-containing protein n=1 Tax=Bifidobacterium lemurum TaxID=1603886 RepID=A0A261FL94_9BIFI|nr:helix-turn-helix transcriptional regulator [Bifidobacterium lemurum]OZG59929.1 hypothetical protein BLEM_2104 [Bifidobacterium lemurum]QOL33950.1 helix-turn-helix transcriptional regulator [Bifidobacterium lemurum]